VKACQGMYWWNERSQADMKPMTESYAIVEAGRRDRPGALTRLGTQETRMMRLRTVDGRLVEVSERYGDRTKTEENPS